MTHPDYWNSVPYSAELDSAAKVPTAASTGKQGFGAAILDSELHTIDCIVPTASIQLTALCRQRPYKTN